jgi:hypothetical protein
VTDQRFVAVTTTAVAKRHWAERGRLASTICGHRAFTQDDLDRMYGGNWLISHLPSCKQCEKSKGRRMLPVPVESSGSGQLPRDG